jgi:hypothetical protein
MGLKIEPFFILKSEGGEPKLTTTALAKNVDFQAHKEL